MTNLVVCSHETLFGYPNQLFQFIFYFKQYFPSKLVQFWDLIFSDEYLIFNLRIMITANDVVIDYSLDCQRVPLMITRVTSENCFLFMYHVHLWLATKYCCTHYSGLGWIGDSSMAATLQWHIWKSWNSCLFQRSWIQANLYRIENVFIFCIIDCGEFET